MTPKGQNPQRSKGGGGGKREDSRKRKKIAERGRRNQKICTQREKTLRKARHWAKEVKEEETGRDANETRRTRPGGRDEEG